MTVPDPSLSNPSWEQYPWRDGPPTSSDPQGRIVTALRGWRDEGTQLTLHAGGTPFSGDH
jgi:hypothetical protein